MDGSVRDTIGHAGRAALEAVEARAYASEREDREALSRILPEGAQADELIYKLLYDHAITLNFHPDRYANNGRLVADNLLADGEYLNQYATGISNGGMNAAIDGNRDRWERRLFYGAYHDGRSVLRDRPKYGALNVHDYADGGAARFGSCFLTLKPHVVGRCTFADGDSNSQPSTVGTARRFCGVLRALFEKIDETGNFCGEEDFSIYSAVGYVLSARRGEIKKIGRNLDHYIEAHIHGGVSLRDDVEALYMDGSFAGTDVADILQSISERCGITLGEVPARRFPIGIIDDEWKGPFSRPVAERIAAKFGCGATLDAALIGLASRDSLDNESAWADIATGYELSQTFKYLWHYAVMYG